MSIFAHLLHRLRAYHAPTVRLWSEYRGAGRSVSSLYNGAYTS